MLVDTLELEPSLWSVSANAGRYTRTWTEFMKCKY